LRATFQPTKPTASVPTSRRTTVLRVSPLRTKAPPRMGRRLTAVPRSGWRPITAKASPVAPALSSPNGRLRVRSLNSEKIRARTRISPILASSDGWPPKKAALTSQLRAPDTAPPKTRSTPRTRRKKP
jgi:hypothetical protein